MTTELRDPATIVADQPGALATEATPKADEPQSKEPLHIPTEEEVKENGLYYYFLSERDRALYKAARKTEGLREEIAMLRLKIAEIHVNDPLNLAVILRAMSLLERLIKTHHRLFVQLPPRGPQTAMNQMAQKLTPDIQLNRAMLRELARKHH